MRLSPWLSRRKKRLCAVPAVLIVIKSCSTTSLLFSRPGSARFPVFSHRSPEEQLHGDPSSSGRVTNLVSHTKVGNRRKNGNGGEAVDVAKLQRENERLKEKLRNLEDENQMLHYEISNRVVIETFEGEGKLRKIALRTYKDDFDDENVGEEGMTRSGADIKVESDQQLSWQQQVQAEQWCDQLDENDSCPVEPFVSFGEALRDRSYWLVGLLILQSFSGIVLSHNEDLLENHPFIIYFLTMLVGAGGNAGNQASVRVIRGLALGTLNEKTQWQFLNREFKMAAALSAILSTAGFVRAVLFRTPFPESIAVTASLAMIVFSSVCLGAILPLILKKLRIDPAHSSTTIQVVMDILGVVLAMAVSSLLLDSPLGTVLISKLGG